MEKDIDKIQFLLPKQLKKDFKIKVTQNDKEMTEVLINFIQKYSANV